METVNIIVHCCGDCPYLKQGFNSKAKSYTECLLGTFHVYEKYDTLKDVQKIKDFLNTNTIHPNCRLRKNINEQELMDVQKQYLLSDKDTITLSTYYRNSYRRYLNFKEWFNQTVKIKTEDKMDAIIKHCEMHEWCMGKLQADNLKPFLNDEGIDFIITKNSKGVKIYIMIG
jgi:hypothetical protein